METLGPFHDPWIPKSGLVTTPPLTSPQDRRLPMEANSVLFKAFFPDSKKRRNPSRMDSLKELWGGDGDSAGHLNIHYWDGAR